MKTKHLITFIISSLILISGFFIIKNININTYTNKNAGLEKEIRIEDKNSFYEITAKYINDKNDKDSIVEKYIKDIVSEKQKEWSFDGALYKGEQEVKKDFPNRPDINYLFDVSYEKTESQKLGVVNYRYNLYEYSGGAHGNNSVTTFSFQNEKLLTIDNIIDTSNNNDIKISKLLANKILENKDLKDYTDKSTVYAGLGLNYLNTKGEFDKLKCACDGFFYGSNLKNFTVTDSGLAFIMDKYQVASGAAGNPEVNFSWSELQPFMNASFDLPLD